MGRREGERKGEEKEEEAAKSRKGGREEGRAPITDLLVEVCWLLFICPLPWEPLTGLPQTTIQGQRTSGAAITGF